MNSMNRIFKNHSQVSWKRQRSLTSSNSGAPLTLLRWETVVVDIPILSSVMMTRIDGLALTPQNRTAIKAQGGESGLAHGPGHQLLKAVLEILGERTPSVLLDRDLLQAVRNSIESLGRTSKVGPPLAPKVPTLPKDQLSIGIKCVRSSA